MKHPVLLRGGPAGHLKPEIEDDEIEFRCRVARAGDALVLDKVGLPPGDRIGGVVVEALYFDGGDSLGGMRIFEFVELDP
jgi:hypothetical protein